MQIKTRRTFYLFRIDITHSIGYGHFFRSFALAKSLLIEDECRVMFMLKIDKTVDKTYIKTRLVESSIELYFLNWSVAPKCELSLIVDLQPSAIFLDLSHSINMQSCSHYVSYINNFQCIDAKLILIDGLCKESLNDEKLNSIDVVVQPYIFNLKNKPTHAKLWLAGKFNLIIDDLYLRQCRKIDC